ncbi:MAG: MFS transporter [Pigmentiphaga sp.]
MIFRSPPPALIVVLSGMVAALHIGKMPVAIPVLTEALDISLLDAGFLLSLVQFAGMTLGVFLGLFCDRIGYRRSVISGQLLLALAGLGGAMTQRADLLMLLRAFEGLGFFLVVLPSPALLRQLVPPAGLTTILGWWGTHMGTGAAVAILAGPALIHLAGWQGFWLILTGISGLMAWALWQYVPDLARPAVAPADQSSSWNRLLLTLRQAGPWRCALAFAFYSSQWLAVIGFLPAIYSQAGLSSGVSGLLTAFACWVNITGSLLAGKLLHRGVAARTLLVTGYLTMAGTTFLTFSTLTQDWPVLRFIAVVLFSAVGGMIPGTLFSIAVKVAPNNQTIATTVGWMLQCSAAGQFFGPPVVAWIAAQAGGWHLTWLATCLSSFLGILMAWRLSLHAGAKRKT